MTATATPPAIDDTDRRLIKATQAGLPLCPRPYHALADELRIPVDDVLARVRRMRETGVIRRVAAVPNHYALGYRANGMSVWDVPDAAINEAGARIGGLDFVSHSYHRPRHPPDWPFNLFAMVHGRDRGEVKDKVRMISRILGPWDRGHRVLFSTRILKKAGLRLVD